MSASSVPALRLAHVSDIHFGRISQPGIVRALVAEINDAAMDLVVVSGDLTQRARTAEYVAARAFLDGFTVPVLVVPGNHDVPAWWHDPVRRVLDPTVRYRRFIRPEPTHEAVLTHDGQPVLGAFGLNTAHGLTIKGGKVRRRELAQMARFFAPLPASAFRVMVVHHHLCRLDALGDHDVSWRGREALEAAAAADVALVLNGHRHISHVRPIQVGPRCVVIASAGTATSNRSREPEGRETNYYNWITVAPDAFTIHERRYDPARARFEEIRATPFRR